MSLLSLENRLTNIQTQLFSVVVNPIENLQNSISLLGLEDKGTPPFYVHACVHICMVLAYLLSKFFLYRNICSKIGDNWLFIKVIPNVFLYLGLTTLGTYAEF